MAMGRLRKKWLVCYEQVQNQKCHSGKWRGKGKEKGLTCFVHYSVDSKMPILQVHHHTFPQVVVIILLAAVSKYYEVQSTNKHYNILNITISYEVV